VSFLVLSAGLDRGEVVSFTDDQLGIVSNRERLFCGTSMEAWEKEDIRGLQPSAYAREPKNRNNKLITIINEG